MFRRLWSETVWSSATMTADMWRMRGIVRFVLPLSNAMFGWFGVVGIINGVGSVERFTSVGWQTWWSIILTLASLAALVGVSFPKLWALELVGKIALISCVGVYVGLYVYRGIHDPNILALSGIMCILMLLPLWRVGDLGYQAWKRGFGTRSHGRIKGDER